MRPLLLALLVLASGCTRAPEPALPDGIAVLGDSISRALNVAGEGFGERPVHNWATGNDPDDGVTSHLERLRRLDPTLDIVAFNDARSGARMSDLADQAHEAVRQDAAYVVVLLGANDVCAATPLAAFEADLGRGAQALAPLHATVLLASVPDVTRLVALYGENETARAVWNAFDVCPRVLAPGADLDAARARVTAYSDALRAEAARRGWTYDGGAVTASLFEAGDVSTVDYFHPSLAGQARLAEVTWDAGPSWRSGRS